MGKRNKPLGLPKEGRKKQRQEIETRALLPGAVYDKATSMLIKTEIGEHGGVATNWTTYYDVMGRELPLKEANARLARANKRKAHRHSVLNRRAANNLNLTAKFWEQKFQEQIQAPPITPEVMKGWVNQLDSLVTSEVMKGLVDEVGGLDIVRVVNRPVLVTNNVSKT